MINKKGAMVLPAEYKMVNDFQSGRCMAFDKNYVLTMFDSEFNPVKTFNNAYSGVTMQLSFNEELCMIHLSHEDPKSPNKLIREWGGVISVYIDKSGKIIWQSKPWYSCFPGDAEITMADETRKRIDQIQPGDKIISYDPSRNGFESSVVNRIDVHEGEFELLSIEIYPGNNLYASIQNLNLPNNKLLRVTPNHTVLTKKGPVAAANIRKSDEIYIWNEMNRTFEIQRVVAVRSSASTERVYNLKTDKSTYVVNGVVVMVK